MSIPTIFVSDISEKLMNTYLKIIHDLIRYYNNMIYFHDTTIFY